MLHLLLRCHVAATIIQHMAMHIHCMCTSPALCLCCRRWCGAKQLHNLHTQRTFSTRSTLRSSIPHSVQYKLWEQRNRTAGPRGCEHPLVARATTPLSRGVASPTLTAPCISALAVSPAAAAMASVTSSAEKREQHQGIMLIICTLARSECLAQPTRTASQQSATPQQESKPLLVRSC